MAKQPMTVRIASKYSQRVTPAQSKFASGLSRVVGNFINVKSPVRKNPYLRSK